LGSGAAIAAAICSSHKPAMISSIEPERHAFPDDLGEALGASLDGDKA
jgi:hypothetical protein